ncbi:MAG TPA: PIN domain-containing protein [Tepidisphaeraceae bacterium]
MTSFTVIYDANVLYPAPLRDLLMWVALQDVVLARWTEEIHEEWIRSVLRERPDLKRDQLERTRDMMNAHVRDCLVTGYQDLITGLTLPDPNDRHVLAAAIKAGASVIVTYNLKHFPAELLDPFGIEAQHPDEFLVYQFDLNKAAICNAVRLQRATLKNPPKSVQELLDTFASLQLPTIVERLRQFQDLL